MANNLQHLFSDNRELTASINKSPFVPSRIAREKLFAERGVSTTKAFIEFSNGRLDLIQSAPRGGVAQPHLSGARDGFEVEAIHLPTRGAVLADEAQDQRGFGGTGLETPQEIKARKLSGMRGNLEATIEIHRLGAIKGTILDSDGTTVLHDLYAEFGIVQATKAMNLAAAGTRLLLAVIDAERQSEDALGGILPSGFLALCAPDFMDALRGHPDYDVALERGRPSDLLTDYRAGITIGNTRFVEYRTPPGGQVRVEAGKAYLIPQGIPDFLLTRFAPADWLETVNTPGLPIYLKAEAMPMDKGYTLEAQSNPISFCSQPAAIIQLTK